MTATLLYLGPMVPDLLAASSGGQVRSYYVSHALMSRNPPPVSLLTDDRNLSFSGLARLWRREVTLWVEFPTSLRVQLLAAFLALVPWVRLISDVHDLPEEQYFALYNRRMPLVRRILVRYSGRFFLRRCSLVLIASPGLRGLLPSSIQARAIDLPPGWTPVTGLADFDIDRQKKLLLYAGGITQGRALDPILRAIGKTEDWEFVVAGFGEQSVIDRILRSPHVRFLGKLSYPDILKLTRSVDAIVIPYPHGPYYERVFPVKLPDSLASGRPILMTRLPVAEAFIRSIGLDGNVVFADELTEESVIQALRKLTGFRVDIEKTARVMQAFTWDAMLGRIMSEVFGAA